MRMWLCLSIDVMISCSADPGVDLSVLQKPVHEWGVRDVCNWLKLMEMEMYIDIFKENMVDGDLLLSLKEEDLQNELKITKPLHLKRLTQKISRLGMESFFFSFLFFSFLFSLCLVLCWMK